MPQLKQFTLTWAGFPAFSLYTEILEQTSHNEKLEIGRPVDSRCE